MILIFQYRSPTTASPSNFVVTAAPDQRPRTYETRVFPMEEQ